MDYTEFGRTGLRVSVAGLGCGGNSALGLAKGGSEADAIAVVHRAMDLGVTLFDTAKTYGTEVALGKAIKGGPRDSVVISTKTQARNGDDLAPASQLAADLDQSLRRLGVETIDIYHLHGVRPQHYDQVLTDLVPALITAREQGKIRYFGVTEGLATDTRHEMAARAARSDVWDSLMIGYHMLNQRPRQEILPAARENGIGVLVMYAVRAIFSRPGRLRDAIRDEVAASRLPAKLAEEENPLSFLLTEGGATSMMDAAYRFARHEPGCDVTLFGTGDVGHVEENVASILRPPLPPHVVGRLYEEFGHLIGVGLDRNGRPAGWGA